MSLFDFLTHDPGSGQPFDFANLGQAASPMPVAQQPDLSPQAAPQVPQGGLLQAPQQPPHGPGLLERFRTANDDGISGADKLYAVGAILGGDSDGGIKYLQTKQAAGVKAKAESEKQALKDKGNRAFKAAYQNGKFDAGAYASVMGSDLDPLSMAKVVKAYAPEGGVSGDFGYTKDPVTGAISWQGERPQGYGEATSAANSAETMRHNQVTEQQGAGHLTVSQAQAALARQREGRLGSKVPAGAASWLPPGARVVHVPGT